MVHRQMDDYLLPVSLFMTRVLLALHSGIATKFPPLTLCEQFNSRARSRTSHNAHQDLHFARLFPISAAVVNNSSRYQDNLSVEITNEYKLHISLLETQFHLTRLSNEEITQLVASPGHNL